MSRRIKKNSEIPAITKEVNSIYNAYLERIPQEWVRRMKLSMEYHNNYLQYMPQKDGWNVVFLNRYRGFPETFGSPYKLCF
jgi:hypothetical protein